MYTRVEPRIMVAYAASLVLLTLAPACPPSPVGPSDVVVTESDAGRDARDAGDAGGAKDSSAEAEAGKDSASPPPADAASLDVFDLACANLRALGCSSGAKDSCADTMRRAQGVLGDFSPACVAKASSKAAVRACTPSMGCP